MTDEPQFSPIAIIGQSCLLPGAHSPEQLWQAVLERRDLISSIPRSYWRLSDQNDAAHPAAQGRSRECVATPRGGHVTGFEKVFDPTGFAVPTEELRGLDPICHWILHAGRECMRSAGISVPAIKNAARGGMVLGNLAYPTAGLAQWAEGQWLGTHTGDARNRFCSGFPTQLAARALGLTGPASTIDAACASSLYAIKLACDRLQDSTADCMIAGGVNRADNLFLHMGFHALGASSKTGQSRPFHRDADGLIPSEGIALILLKRLDDAIRQGDTIHGVIRGVGLSNDGRAQGLLVPSEDGQVRAMEQAYRCSGLDPREIDLVECHATGTPVGDAVEIRSMSRVFGRANGSARLPIGSLKSNIGHLITAAGAAGLLKVLAAFKHRTLPPVRSLDDELEAIATSRFRVVREPEPWHSASPRRAAVSAFGFGGNNAHLILEEWTGTPGQTAALLAIGTRPASDEAVAIVGMSVATGAAPDLRSFARKLFNDCSAAPDTQASRHCESIELPARSLRFPPRDLERTLPQQLLALRTAMGAVADAGSIEGERVTVLMGMQCDAEIARSGARWRLPDLAPGAEITGDDLYPELVAAPVVGTMPNIVANRINSHFDLRGPGFAVFSEELSGITALELGARALRAGEVDTAVIGAVDLSCEPVHQAAAARVLTPGGDAPGDAAAVLVLKRLRDAERDGDTIYAVLPKVAEETAHTPTDRDNPEALFGDTPSGRNLAERIGHAHAVSGLLHVVGAVLACHLRAMPVEDGRASYPWLPSRGPRQASVDFSSFTGQRVHVLVEQSRQQPGAGWLLEPDSSSRVHVFRGRDREEIIAALHGDRVPEAAGPATLSIVCAQQELAYRREEAATRLRQAGSDYTVPFVLGPGMYFRNAPVGGELAFVYTFAAASYAGMGRDLLLAIPQLLEGYGERFEGALAALPWIYEGGSQPDHMAQLRGFSLLCHAHSRVTRDVLRLRPDAALGISSGESSALFCLGAWDRPEQMFRQIEDSGLYSRELAGEFRAVQRAWRKLGHTLPVDWQCWRVFLPAETVRAALAPSPFAHLLIIHAPEDCLIGGRAEDCERVTALLGRRHCMRVEGGMAAHCPELREFAEEWRAVHSRPTRAVPGVRFYSNGNNRQYTLKSESVADNLVRQAVNEVDFPATVRQAWNDGVRVFVEHGPWGLCRDWIAQTLDGREHLVVSLDRAGVPAVQQLLDAVAQLVAAGVPVDIDALHSCLYGPSAPETEAGAGTVVSFKGHLPRVPAPSKRSGQPYVPEQSETVPVPPQAMRLAPPVPLILRVRAAMTNSPEKNEPALNDTLIDFANEDTATIAQSVEQPNWAAALLERHAAVHRDWFRIQTERQHAYLESRERLLLPIAGAALQHASSQAVLSTPDSEDTSLRQPTRTNAADPALIAKLSVRPPAGVLPPSTSRRRNGSESPTGPSFTREQLEMLSHGQISSVFGEIFAQQDGYAKQVRMPMPPLLLADRVTGIHAEPGALGTGTIWTETDICQDSWYLHEGRMPAGIMIESGQADLLLISWMGADFLNRGERVYRLLGCELSYHGSLPKVGETLKYAIHIDGHANQGDTRLFFFHYDCRVAGDLRLSVRGGQAGFFSEEELANSMGILWDPATAPLPPAGVLDAPSVPCIHRAFSREQVRAFAAGDAFACFGPGFEFAQTHVRTPRIQSGDMLLFDEVTRFDPTGGPWGRGYLRAVLNIRPDHWFFQGHFKNDPCMPGTLMFEGCLQAMALYLAAMGYTLDRDGWRFEPVPEEKVKLSCRGQVLPTSRQVVCELFVREVSAGPIPTLHTDLLGTVDGLRAFHASNMGFRLVPDWPLSTRPELLADYKEPKPVASVDGFEFGYASLLACAWGKPTEAFGQMYRDFDGVRRVARLPGPPYHFMSRVVKLEGAMGIPKPGAYAELEYDIPPDAWYFEENASGTMPACVLLEAALQPCGWLASYLGCSLGNEEDLAFRNLDGTGTTLAEIRPGATCLRTKVSVTSVSHAGGMIILGFNVECDVDDVPAYRMTTVFGFFPAPSLKNQAGLPSSEEQRSFLALPDNARVELSTYPKRYFSEFPRLPASKLLMLDRITGFWPDGGSAGLGKVRGEKDVTASEWFFKAHFFQDPVQPGSLGIEALLQLLKFYMIETGMGAVVPNARFEPMMVNEPMTWKYRGQVLPHNKKIVSEMEIVDVGRDERGLYVIGNGNMYVDGKRIYQATRSGMRIVADDIRTDGPDLLNVRSFWRRQMGMTTLPLEDFYSGLIEQFVERIALPDTAIEATLKGRSVLYLGNHQTQIESMLFLLAMSSMMDLPVVALANAKHRTRWLGELVAHTFSYPGMRDPNLIRYFDQSRPESLPAILDALGQGLRGGEHSVLIHAEGTRQTSAGQSVARVSALLAELAINSDVVIVPVRFSGGLPVTPLAAGKLEFPVGYTGQVYTLGRPIEAAELRSLNLLQRKQRILDAIQLLGSPRAEEVPGAPDWAFAEKVQRRMQERTQSEVKAVLSLFLDRFPVPADMVSTPEQRTWNNALAAWLRS